MKNSNLSIFCVVLYTSALCAVLFCIFSCVNSFYSLTDQYYEANTKGAAVKTPAFQDIADDMKLRKVKFTFSNPQAKEVLLHADFNLWGLHKLPLKKESDGTFSIMVILPQGEYKYYFLSDGTPVMDKTNKQKTTYMGREASLRTVL